jgi:hypothetical protein
VSDTKFLVVRPHSGLGNRLRALVSAWRLAGRSGRTLAVEWVLDKYHLWCPYERLFDAPRLLQVGEGQLAGLGDVREYRVGPEPVHVEVRANEPVVRVVEENFFWAADEPAALWGQYGPHRVADPAVREELLAGFVALVPAPGVRRAVEVFTPELGARAVGVHVRRGDNVWSKRHCTDALFVRALDAVLDARGDCRVFVATDGNDFLPQARARYGVRVVAYPVRSLARGADPLAAEDALVTMLLLARCSVLVRSVSSTFSQCASWFGRVPTVDVGQPQHAF